MIGRGQYCAAYDVGQYHGYMHKLVETSLQIYGPSFLVFTHELLYSENKSKMGG